MTRRPALSRLAALLTVALGLSLAPAALAHADQDSSWTVRTASNGFGAERTAYGYALDPGATASDALVVSNHGDRPLDLGVYAADGYTNGDGALDLVAAGAASTGVGAWVTTPQNRITVDPGAQITVPFTIAIPANATPGDYAGGIVTSLASGGDVPGLSVDRRLGIRIDVRVGGALSPSLAIERLSVSWDGGLNPLAWGDATVSYTLHNTGNTRLTDAQTARVTGAFGWFPHDVEVGPSPTLLPGESWDVSARVPDVAAVLLLIGSATAIPVLVDASGSTTAMDPVAASAAGIAIPWLALILLVVLAAVVVAAVLLVRRRNAERARREDARVDAAVRRALEERGGAEPEVGAPTGPAEATTPTTDRS